MKITFFTLTKHTDTCSSALKLKQQQPRFPFSNQLTSHSPAFCLSLLSLPTTIALVWALSNYQSPKGPLHNFPLVASLLCRNLILSEAWLRIHKTLFRTFSTSPLAEFSEPLFSIQTSLLAFNPLYNVSPTYLFNLFCLFSLRYPKVWGN